MGESNRVCNVCKKTDFAFALDPSRWGKGGPDNRPGEYDNRAIAHHPSVASLRSSALQGCPACLFFAETLQLPLRVQEPETWGRHEAAEAKKRTKAAKNEFGRVGEEAGPLFISAIKASGTHEDFAPPNGVVAGFRYGCETSIFGSRIVGVIASNYSPKSVGIRNLLHHTDIGLCRKWLKQCQSEHDNCPSISERNLPTRLIDVGGPGSDIQPQLVETRGQRGQYVTLSHCWGGSRPPSTTEANISSRMLSMTLDSMPKTFRDAIDITRLLDYRYLWIDSLCIIQDNDADWQRECASMAAIFSNCVVTLAAPFASDCEVGFPRGLHPILAETWCDIPVHWPGAANPDLVRAVYPDDANQGRVDWDESPLANRAWVLQERLLSPRWLYFGNDSLYFECSTAKFDEHIRVPLTLSTVRLGTYFHTPKDAMSFNTYEEGLSRWYSMIHTYSRLCLTYGSDRLPALSGIVARFATTLGDEYIAGMWRKDLVFGLIFRVEEPKENPHSTEPHFIRGPSWSWYSCDRTIQPLHSHPDRFTARSSGGVYERAQFISRECFGPLIEVTHLSATPLGENKFGAVRDARLTVVGRLQDVWCGKGKVLWNEDGKIIGEISEDAHGIVEGRKTARVSMLPIAITGNWVDGRRENRSWHALALAEIPEQPKTYRRIGLIHEYKDENRGSARGKFIESDNAQGWTICKSLFAPPLEQLHLI